MFVAAAAAMAAAGTAAAAAASVTVSLNLVGNIGVTYGKALYFTVTPGDSRK